MSGPHLSHGVGCAGKQGTSTCASMENWLDMSAAIPTPTLAADLSFSSHTWAAVRIYWEPPDVKSVPVPANSMPVSLIANSGTVKRPISRMISRLSSSSAPVRAALLYSGRTLILRAGGRRVGQTVSPVGLAAMAHTANLDSVSIWANEEEPIVAYT